MNTPSADVIFIYYVMIKQILFIMLINPAMLRKELTPSSKFFITPTYKFRSVSTFFQMRCNAISPTQEMRHIIR